MDKARANGHSNGQTSMNAFMADSAEQAWLAGVGAVARARRSGLKACSGLIGTGRGVRHRSASAVAPGVNAVLGVFSDARRTAVDALGRLEEIVEARITRTLNRMQIPTARDIQELTRRVQELTRAVQRLDGDQSPGKRRAAKKRTATSRRRKTGRKDQGSAK